MSRIKPLQQKSKNLKQELMRFMKEQKLQTCPVDDKTCTLYKRKVKKPMNRKLLLSQLEHYHTTPSTKEEIQRFIASAETHINTTAVEKDATRIK